VKNFVVYEEGGTILRSGVCAEADFVIQAQDGEFILEGVADDATQMVVDGSVVDKEHVETDELKETNARLERDALLRESDWTQVLDAPLTDDQKTQYRTYRQALRDITLHQNWPNLDDEDWPTLET
jgi:hypothetical protein